MVFLRVVMGLVVAVVISWSSALEAGYERINRPNPKDPMDVHIYQLDNGLTVYLTQNHEEPRFYVEIVTRGGSRDDPAESTGLAHYLEHLLFKGTQRLGTLDWEKERPHIRLIETLYEEHWKEKDPEKRKTIYAKINKESQKAAAYAIPNEIDRLYQSIGGSRINASTGKDRTNYMVDLPANRLEQWAMIESERFTNPVYRLFQPELEIVYEEKNRSLENKDRILLFAVLKQLFKIHPIGQQTGIGTVEHLKNPSLANIHDYFKKFYVPNNMAIAISGSIDIEKAIETIDMYFSSWERGETPDRGKWVEKPLSKIDTVEVIYPGEEQVTVAFRAPGKQHPDHDAWVLADYVMSNGRAGLIDLVNQRQEVREAHAYSSPYLDYSYEQFTAVPKKGQTLEEAQQILLGQIAKLRKGEFDDDLIPTVIAQFKKDDKAGLESNVSRVNKMVNAFSSYYDWDAVVSRLDRMGKITKTDVVRVSKEYFGGNYVVGFRRDAPQEVPKIKKPAIDKIDIDPTRQSVYAKSVLEKKPALLPPVFVDPEKDYQVVEVQPGVKLYYSKNPFNDLFSLSVNFDVGFNQNNLVQFASLLLDRSGTVKFSPEDLKKEWYRLGTDFSFLTGNNESSFSVAGLEENFDASMALMQEVTQRPVADQETLDKLIQITLGRRETSKKDPRFLRLALVLYARYGDTSRLLRRIPSEQVKALKVDDLLGIVKGLPTYEHNITYVGNRSVDEVLAALKMYHPLGKSLREPPPYRYDRARALESTELLHLQQQKAASDVQVEQGDGLFDESIIPVVEMYNEYFAGGMSGVIFQEIREARALAYSVGARYVSGGRTNAENLMFANMGTQADKTPEAIEALVGLLDTLPESEDRYKAAHAAKLNDYLTGKIGFREILGVVRRWELQSLEVDPRVARFQKVKQIGLADVVAFQKEHLAGRPKLISVVGDSTKMDMVKLRSLGVFRSVTADDVATF